MKKRLTNNLGLKLGSVITAAFLWLIVVNIDDPIIPKQFGPIPVTILNESAITGEGKVYQVLDESDSVYIKCEGNRSVIEKLDNPDFLATANMEDLNFLDTVPIYTTLNKNVKGIEIVSQAKTLKVSIEDAETKQLAMTVITKGTPQAGYAVGTLTASPNIVRITGPTSIVKKVSQIRAEVNVENWNKDGNVNTEPRLYDNYGDEVDSSRVKFSASEITVTVDIDETKSVGFNFDVYGEAAEGYQYTGLTYEPTEVVIAGTAAVINKIHAITVPRTAINIEGANGDMEKVIDITDYLPKGARLVDDSYASVLVTAHIEQLEAKTITIPVTNIGVLNLPDNLNYSYNHADELAITIRGLRQDLDSLDVNGITATIDLEQLPQGNHSVPVTINLPEEYQVIGEVFAEIALTEKTSTNSQGATGNAGTINNRIEPEPTEEDTDVLTGGVTTDGEDSQTNTGGTGTTGTSRTGTTTENR